MPTLVEIAKQEVIEAAKAYMPAKIAARQESPGALTAYFEAESRLFGAVTLLKERERVAATIASVEPHPGKEPIPRRPKKLSRMQRLIEARRQSDPMGQDREDIDYSSTEDPEAR